MPRLRQSRQRVWPHASTVVDDQPHSYRNILVTEMPNFLRHSVLVDLKLFFAESGNKSAFAVLSGRVKHHLFNGHANGVVVNP